jgi:hypothetical protein
MCKVTLRAERDGPNCRYLSASLDGHGALVIEGQDLGPGTAIVSSDSEYEWTRTILSEHIPKLLVLLNAPVGANILAVLKKHWTGSKSHELERRIRDSDIPSKLWTWSG